MTAADSVRAPLVELGKARRGGWDAERRREPFSTRWELTLRPHGRPTELERLAGPSAPSSATPHTSPLDLALERGLPAVSANGIIKVTGDRPVR